MSTRLDDDGDRDRATDGSDARETLDLELPDPSARIVDADEDFGDVPVVDITDESNAGWTREDDRFVPPSAMDADEFRTFVDEL